ncbi:MAG: TRAP transporter substrate-binding protein DctP [Bacteriovoracaceae bacterium]
MRILSVILLSLFLSFSLSAAVTIKASVLAPEGTNWANNLKKMAKEIDEQTKGNVKLKVYFGGVQGDEPDVLRKIRVKQMSGGLFTGRTLGDIFGDIRVVELPFNFKDDRALAYKTLTGMTPFFNKGLKDKGFVNLGFFEIGLVHLVTMKEIKNLDELKGVKIWSWEGDPLAAALIQTMKLVSVPLSLPDVLGALSTGMVEAAYSPPLAILALQWETKIKYFVDTPVTYSIGAFLVDNATWASIPLADQKIVEDVCRKYTDIANQATVKENQDVMATLKNLGVKVVKFPETDTNQAQKIRAGVIEKLVGKGKLISAEALKLFDETVKKK